MDILELRRKRAELIDELRKLNDSFGDAQLDETQQAAYDALKAQIEALKTQIDRQEEIDRLTTDLRSQPGTQPQPQAPVVLRYAGDDRKQAELRAVRLYVRGDEGAIREMDAQMRAELRASNDTDMNITTPADGGYLVPTAHYTGIIAKANSIALAERLGVMPFAPEGGTTLNVPVQAGTTNVFVSTNEASLSDRDAPEIGRAQMTLVKFTKAIELSEELMYDEGSNLMTFLNFYVGEALGLTHNNALITEALTNGTSVTLAAAATVSAADVPTLVYALKGRHSPSAQWVMRRATEGAIRKLQGSDFLFAETPAGAPVVGPTGATLWKYPLWNEDETMPAVGAGNKSILFGNFGYMGRRSTALTFLRDPYSRARYGQVVLHYYTRIAYKVLQPEAILYGRHPTA